MHQEAGVSNIRECDMEMILEKILAWNNNNKKSHVGTLTGTILLRCFGHCCPNRGCTATWIPHVPSTAPLLVTQGYFIAAGSSALCLGDVPTLEFLCRGVMYLHSPCNGMAWRSLTMRLCDTVLQVPFQGVFENRAQRTQKRPLESGICPSTLFYLKPTWHNQLAQTRMTGESNCTTNALQTTVGMSFIRIINYSLWRTDCCKGQHVQN